MLFSKRFDHIVRRTDMVNAPHAKRRCRTLTDLGELFHGLGQVSEVFVQNVRHHLQGRVGHGMPTDVRAYPGDRRGQAVPDELVRHFWWSRNANDRNNVPRARRPVKRPPPCSRTALGRTPPFPRTTLQPRSGRTRPCGVRRRRDDRRRNSHSVPPSGRVTRVRPLSRPRTTVAVTFTETNPPDVHANGQTRNGGYTTTNID